MILHQSDCAVVSALYVAICNGGFASSFDASKEKIATVTCALQCYTARLRGDKTDNCCAPDILKHNACQLHAMTRGVHPHVQCLILSLPWRACNRNPKGVGVQYKTIHSNTEHSTTRHIPLTKSMWCIGECMVVVAMIKAAEPECIDLVTTCARTPALTSPASPAASS